jgi:Lrp/AsnC family transcriptional regulator, regulator for asnA, asnC and gidA
MMDFDKLDSLLLYELDTNCRQSFNSLSKKLKVNKDTVKYRVQRFLDLGVIKSFNAVVDTGKLGFFSFRIFMKFYQVSVEMEAEIIDYLLSSKNLIWLVQVTSVWDINTCFLYKSVDEMNYFLDNFMEKYGNFVSKKQIAIFTGVNYFARADICKKQSNLISMSIFTLPKKCEIDDTEMKLLSILSKNARTTIIDIAQQAKVVPKTVISKIKRLEKEKIIVGYRAEFDLNKLGYAYYKIHINSMNLTLEKRARLTNFLFEHPLVIYNNHALGGFDIDFEIQVKGEEGLLEFMGEFRKKFSEIIKDYEILNYYKEYKLRFFPTG